MKCFNHFFNIKGDIILTLKMMKIPEGLTKIAEKD